MLGPNDLASGIEAQKQYRADVQKMSKKQEEEFRNL